jgi:hypothetical protein
MHLNLEIKTIISGLNVLPRISILRNPSLGWYCLRGRLAKVSEIPKGTLILWVL